MSYSLVYYASQTEQYELDIEHGEIEISPKIKYKYDKENPVNPRKRFRLGKYHEDSIKCTAIVTPAQYVEIYNFLLTNELVDDEDLGLGLYLRIGTTGNNGFPITSIDKIPVKPNDLNEFTGKITFTLISQYTDNPHLPLWSNYGAENYGSGNFGY